MVGEIRQIAPFRMDPGPAPSSFYVFGRCIHQDNVSGLPYIFRQIGVQLKEAQEPACPAKPRKPTEPFHHIGADTIIPAMRISVSDNPHTGRISISTSHDRVPRLMDFDIRIFMTDISFRI